MHSQMKSQGDPRVELTAKSAALLSFCLLFSFRFSFSDRHDGKDVGRDITPVSRLPAAKLQDLDRPEPWSCTAPDDAPGDVSIAKRQAPVWKFWDFSRVRTDSELMSLRAFGYA